MNKKHLFLTAAVMVFAIILVSCGQRQAKNTQTGESTPVEATAAKADTSVVEPTDTVMNKEIENPLYEIHTSMGTITVMLYRETPIHLANFENLVKRNYYDGILFHRVIPGFMIQVGDPLTKDPDRADEYGTGGPGYTIPAEIKSEFTHKKGALAAARRGDAANPKRESSGSQFYIVQDAQGCSHLDGQYTIFGETVDGLNVIDKIAGIPTDHRDRPLQPVKIESITKVE